MQASVRACKLGWRHERSSNAQSLQALTRHDSMSLKQSNRPEFHWNTKEMCVGVNIRYFLRRAQGAGSRGRAVDA